MYPVFRDIVPSSWLLASNYYYRQPLNFPFIHDYFDCQTKKNTPMPFFESPLTFIKPSILPLVVVTAGGIGFLWLVSQRLLLSPLAKFPGPRFAALTRWVETYYDCFHLGGGQFLFKYREWRETYGMRSDLRHIRPVTGQTKGPVVRVSPWGIHIQDSTFHEVMYSVKPQHKPKEHEKRFNHPSSAFATSDHHLHRLRRSVLNPFFSKRRIVQRSTSIQQCMDRLCNRLKQDFARGDVVLTLNDMWACFTSDVIVEYCFERRYDFIQEPGFKCAFAAALLDLIEPVHLVTHFQRLQRMLNCLPDRVVTTLMSGMASVNWFIQVRAHFVHFKDRMIDPYCRKWEAR